METKPTQADSLELQQLRKLVNLLTKVFNSNLNTVQICVTGSPPNNPTSVFSHYFSFETAGEIPDEFKTFLEQYTTRLISQMHKQDIAEHPEQINIEGGK